MNASSPSERPTAGRAVKKATTRDRIARAAVELQHEQGYDQVTVADIAARAGVSTRTFHNYFARRDHAHWYFFERVFDAVQGITEYVDPRPTPVEHMRVVGECLLDLAASEYVRQTAGKADITELTSLERFLSQRLGRINEFGWDIGGKYNVLTLIGQHVVLSRPPSDCTRARAAFDGCVEKLVALYPDRLSANQAAALIQFTVTVTAQAAEEPQYLAEAFELFRCPELAPKMQE